jgi:histidyl-tRNA synthetase
MIRLKGTRFETTSSFFDHCVGVAGYYGFVPLESLPKTPPRHGDASTKPKEDDIIYARREERALASAAKKSAAVMPPLGSAQLAWRITPGSGASAPSLELHVLGVPTGIAEALLIVVTDAIAREAGIETRTLSLNNVGSAESFGRYVRDVGTYLRKHLETISPTLRPRAATDPLGTLVQLIERKHPAVPRAPQAMEYLTEEERRRFWELLEYLEASGISYELDNLILGSRDVWTHTLFEMSAVDRETGQREPFAFGGRYDPLVSRFARAPVHGATVTIVCEQRGASRGPKVLPVQEPSIYFAHLGAEARRRTLGVLEDLRRARIPVHQGLWHERIGDQMLTAHTLGVPYILIMGHKEAVEGTVLVREVATNSQEAVAVPDLTGYLRRRRLGVPAGAR